MSTKVKIDTYRGWEIFFDVEDEKFYCASDRWDQQEDRGSFKACKKWVDDFLKSNDKFHPVEFERFSYGHFSDRLTIIGRRKDGLFVTQNSKGERGQLSKYYEKDFIRVDPANDPVKIELRKLDLQIKELESKKKEAEARLTVFTAHDLRNELEPLA